MSREVASCFIIDEQDRILIVRRSDTDWWKPLHWEIPGGKIDKTDFSARGAAMREGREETGLLLDDCKFLEIYEGKELTKFYFVSRSWKGQIQIPITQLNGVIEHDQYKWCSIDELKEQEDLIIPVSVFIKALKK